MYRIFFILLLLATQSLYAQKNTQKYRNADRCADIDRGAPIQNIFVDDSNNKWVSDFKGLYLAQSPDHAKFLTIPDDQWSLLNMKDGNAELKIPKAELFNLMGDAFEDINTAAYDNVSQTLYIGTTEYGIYQFKTKPKLELIGGIDKLKSDYINTIFIENNGKTWIGTEQGVLVGKPGSWKLIEKSYDILSITRNESIVYLLADGETIIELDSKNKGYIVEIEDRYIDGEIKDIAVDSKGKIWIASEIIAGYDPVSDRYEEFGPAENYTSQFVSYLAVDKDDALWVGTEDKGVYFIGASSSFSVSLVKSKDLSCSPNAKDAALEVRANGGQPPYSYKWTDAAMNGDQPKNIGAGEYTVTVTDSKGKTKTAQIVIEDPRMSIQIRQEKTASFGGSEDGSATLKVSGGTPGYTYQWDNGEKTATAVKLSQGKHSVTISDKTGCSATVNIEISQGLAALSATVKQTKNIKCPGDQTGGLRALVTGGKEPYTYSWDKSTEKTAEISNLAAGEYKLTVKDTEGGNIVATVTVEGPPPMEANITVQAAATANNKDGKAIVKISGGSEDYSYKWDTGETTEVATKLGAGTHTVTVTDKNACSTTAEIVITEDILPLETTLTQTGIINCSGESTGAVEVKVNGGKAPYQYQWSDASIQGNKIKGLKAGAYQLTVTDAAKTSSSATINIKEPESLSLSVSAKAAANLGQQDGKATAKAKGGLGKYSFKWSNGETSDKAVKLGAGTHDVTVTDGKGCSTVASVEIGEDVQALSINLEQVQKVTCVGEASASLVIEISGGKPPFQYNWTNDLNGDSPTGLAAGDYAVTVTDAAGNTSDASFKIEEPKALNVSINPKSPASTNNKDGKAEAKATGGTGKYTYQWDTGETSATAEKLGAGTHTVTITDENACTSTASIDITEDILPLSVQVEQTQTIACVGDASAALTVEISGGKSPFEYQWANGLSGEKPTGLAAGDYAVTITDAAGTSQNASIKIENPTVLSVSINPKSPATTNNKDGKAEAKATGGTGKYTYQWDTGETAAKAEKLGAGTHSVTITDEKGCTTTANIDITEDILPLSVQLEQTQTIACVGDASAALTVEISGGKSPFEYQWANGLNGEKPTGLAAGDYTVTITDAAGTSQNASIKIEEPTALNVSINPKSPATTNNKDGKAEAKATGGTGKYTYKWDTGETSATAEKLGAGTHSLTITDEKGCTTTANIDITEDILPLTANLTQTTDNKCFDDKAAAIALEINGGKSPFKYAWSNSAITGEKANNLAAGDYTVTITDAAGTSQTATISIPALTQILAEITVNSPASTGNEDGKATVNAKGGTGEFAYKWDNGETTEKANKLGPGKHSLTVTDSNGCTAVATTDISENILELTVAIQQTAENKCFGEQTAALEVEINGGKGPFEYTWSQDGITGTNASNLKAGTYTVNVKDAIGTEQSANITIATPDALGIELVKNKPATNEDSKDGKAEIKVSGGTSPYTYLWDNSETGAINTKMSFGTHQVTVTDAKGCTTNLDMETGKKIMPALTAGRLRAGQTLKLEKLYFPADSTKMTPESLPTIDEIHGFLEDNPKIIIEIGGHTNGIPAHDYCDQLSTARAKNVADYIVAKGIDPTRVVYKGYGKRKPLMTNKTETGRKRNQRVEVKILDLGQ